MKLLQKTSLTLLLFIMSVFGCINNSEPSPAKEAFTNASMKPWFDSNCARCHSSGKVANKDWLYDPSDYQKSIKKHIATIYQEVVTEAVMPEDKDLTATEMKDFVNWYNAGAKAN
jgi:mono/diheme cytochrome c family protein